MNQNIEITKIFVTAAVAVMGVLAGFITSFFAEPVKIYFQKRARLKDLKEGLYKEMWHNFTICSTVMQLSSEKPERQKGSTLRNFFEMEIKTEYYQYTMKNELALFYQLKGISYWHTLYGYLGLIESSVKVSNYSPILLYYDLFIDLYNEKRLDSKLLFAVMDIHEIQDFKAKAANKKPGVDKKVLEKQLPTKT